MSDVNTLLEKWFLENANKYDKFPDPTASYINRYLALKSWLVTNCYQLIGSATSVEDGGFYTSHGPDHFNQVIHYAGELLNLQKTTDQLELNCYEVYLLLTGILLHDAGNVFGRAQHERKAFAILQDAGAAVTTCNIEKKNIANIAEVHGGKTNAGDKDTINNKFSSTISDYLNATYRPKLISAIVRFADEICENKTRAARYSMQKNTLPKSSEVFHYYANAITASKVDCEGREVRIQFDIDHHLTQRKFGKIDNEVYLIDEIFERIEKMHCERIYCSRFFQGKVHVDSIRVTINIVDENYDVIDRLFIDTRDGYPSESLNLHKVHTRWCGEELKARFEQHDA